MSPRRFLLWLLPAGAALAAGGLFTAGFAAALSGRLGTPVGDAPAPAPTPTPPRAASDSIYRIVALGDSLTRGAGDTGRGGYPGRIAEELRKEGRAVEVENLGVDGSETADLVRKLKSDTAMRSVKSADVILISISGNDLTHSAPAFFGAGEGDPTAPTLERVRTNIAEILRLVRDANPAAPVRLLGLYNPFPSQRASDQRLAREVLLRFNDALEQATFVVPGALVVPTADVFEARPDRLSADRFHPGPSGYDAIATRVLATLPAAAPESRKTG